MPAHTAAIFGKIDPICPKSAQAAVDGRWILKKTTFAPEKAGLPKPPFMNKKILLAASTLLAAPAFAALTAAPTILYTFDSGSGTTDSQGAMNLTTAGTTTTGLFGTGADASPTTTTVFRGPTSSTNPGASDLTQPGTGDFSLSFWYKAGATNPTTYAEMVWQGGLWAGGPNQTAGYALELRSDGKVGLLMGDINSTSARAVSLTSTGTVNLGGWNNIVMTVNASTNMASLYLNNVVNTASFTAGTNFAVNNAAGEWYREFTLGKPPVGSGSIAGSAIDDLGIWKGSVLSAGEVSRIYNGGAGASIASLIAVPEPSAYGLMGAGSLAAAALVRRRRGR